MNQIKKIDGTEYHLMDTQARPLKHHAEQLKKIGTIKGYRIVNGRLYVRNLINNTKGSRFSSTQLGNKAYTELKSVSIHGLPKRKDGTEIYNSFNDYLFDFYSDLPWTPCENAIAIRHIMSKSDYNQTMNRIKNKFNFDMDNDFKSAIRESEKECR